MGQRGVEDSDLVGCAVRAGTAFAQQRGQRLSGAAVRVVDEGQHGMEPEPAFVVRGGTFLLRVRTDQGRVQVDHDLAGLGHRRPVPPGAGPGLGAGGTDRSHGCVGIGGQRLDQPAHRGVGGDRTEQLALCTHQTDIGQTVAAQGEGDGQVQHRLARIVERTRSPPRRQRRTESAIEPAGPGGLQQQYRARRRNQRLAASLDVNP